MAPKFEKSGTLAKADRTPKLRKRSASRTLLNNLQLAAVDAAANAIIITDKNGTVLWANSAFERLSGYTREEAKGQNPRMLRSGRHSAEYYQQLWSTIVSGSVWRGEITNRRKDGSLYTERMTITPIRISGAEVSHFIAVNEDITESKLLDAALSESDQRFRMAFEKGPLGIVFVDPEYRLINMNAAFCAMLRYTVPELRGKSLAELTHPKDAARDKEITCSIMKGEIPARTWEKRYIKKTGEVVSVEVTSTAIMDAQGKPVYGMGIIQDISKRKASENAVRHAEEKYRQIFREAIMGVFQTTSDGRFVVANPELLRILGYGSLWELTENVTNIGVQLYVDPKRCIEFQRLIDSQGFVRGFECELYRKDRSRIWASMTAKLAHNESGATVYEGMLEDITEPKLLREQLREAQKLEAVGQLAGGVAHDFNNALGVIIGYSELLQERLSATDPLLRYVAGITKEVQKAASLTQQLLTFSRKQVIQPVPLDLNTTVANIEKMLCRVIGEDVRLRTVLESPLELIFADPGQIEQVIINLAVNARDAMPNGGELTIKTANFIVKDSDASKLTDKPKAYVSLTVKDTGCGIPSDIKPHIFEPFFTTKPPGKGTGLGLATVYGVVQQSGGFISVESEPGKGTTFTILFPRIRVSELPLPGEISASTKRISGTETILLVEDEPGLREVFIEALAGKGYTVFDAENGERALELANVHEGPLHLVITDVVMPGISGPKLVGELLASRPELKVLYISGHTRDLIAGHGMLHDSAALLRKPFTPEFLLGQIRSILDGVQTDTI